MKAGVLSRRYARAFFKLGVESGKSAELLSEIEGIVDAAKQVPTLLQALDDFQIKSSQRHALVDSLRKEIGFSQFTSNLLNLLIDKKRISLLELITVRYRELYEEMNRLATAQLALAEKSEAEEVSDRVRVILGKLLGREARCEVKVDESLLGGFVVRVGDTVFDASVKGRLERMKEDLLSV